MARALWVLALIALAALVFYGMRRGWVNRARRQADRLPAFPEPPRQGLGEELAAPATGLYVGTTTERNWLDRVVVGDIGHRANATARLSGDGLLLDREGASRLWLPAAALRDVRIDQKLAGKVMPGSGMLVVTWLHGDQLLDTGFRADDKTVQGQLAEAVRVLVPAGRGERAPAEDEAVNKQEER